MFLLLFMLLSPHRDSENVNLASFERVWQIIQEKHWDLAATGVDWNQIHTEYLPRAQKAKSHGEMREIIEEMIGRLGQTHFGLLGGQSFSSIDNLKYEAKAGASELGWEVRRVGDGIFVTRIDPQGEAYEKGVRLGSQILQIGPVKAEQILTAVDAAYANSHQRGLYTVRTLNEFVHHSVGSSITYQILLPGQDQPSSIAFDNAKSIQLTSYFPNMPPMHYQFEKKLIEDKWAYVTFNLFLQPLIQDFPNALSSMPENQGLIIDLRGNPGGLGWLANGIAGYLIAERGQKLGTMQAKEGTLNFFIAPRPNRYEKPVAILIDEASASTSEILAQGLKDLKRARIFGTNSAGAALPSFIETLPNGDRFQYAFGNYTSIGGVEIEGKGVAPDETTPHTLTSMSHSHDATLDAAVTWLKTQTIR
ncbi:MAG: hypothetical protein H6510_05800 [Acidobacteria bacterium]|nr:hypothetical protein [Acidobacteriota bacterium]MCB9397307.1 hypothetical protein [Acidobacteriota bacterium]